MLMKNQDALADAAQPSVPTAPLDNAAPTGHRTPDADRVPVLIKCAYGAAGAVTVFQGHLPKTLATPVLVVMLGLSPSSVSLAMFVFRLYDAILDPLMGWISDNTRTRFGRRRPYMFVGSILVGLFLPVMWLFDPAWSHQTLLIWFLATGLLLYTFATIFAMPYESLSLELTPDYNERTSVNSYKAMFQKLSVVVIGWSWFITQLPIFADARTGAADTLKGALGMSVIVGIVIIALGVTASLIVKERFYHAAAKQPKISLKDNFRFTFTNRPFLLLASMSVLFGTATYLCWGIAFYLRLYYVTQGDQVLAAKIGGVESTLTMLLGIASIPCFAWLARRVGKGAALMVAMGITFVAMWTNWFTYDPRYPWLSMTASILLAPSITGIWQLIPSMNGDIVDHDELRTGERREGAFASIYSWIVSLSFTLGIGLAGPIVEACGFLTALGPKQTPETIFNMRIAFAIVPGVLLGLAMLILTRYPLSPARMQTIRIDLEARRGRL